MTLTCELKSLGQPRAALFLFSMAMLAYMVEEFPQPVVQEKLEVFDWLRRRQSRSLLKNPAGWLVMSIRNDYAAPPGFESRRKHEARRQEQQQRLQSLQQKTQAQQNEQEQQQAAVDSWLRILSADDRQALEQEAMEHGEPILVRQYRKTENEATRRSLKQLIIRRYAARKMPKQEP